jgi:hypothetical protein
MDASNCSYQICYNPIYDGKTLLIDEKALLMETPVEFHVQILVMTVVKNQLEACWVLIVVERAQLLVLTFQLASLFEIEESLLELVYIHAYALHITIKILEFPRHNIVLIRQDDPRNLAT